MDYSFSAEDLMRACSRLSPAAKKELENLLIRDLLEQAQTELVELKARVAELEGD